MRSAKFLLVAAALFAGVSLAIVGCGDDETPIPFDPVTSHAQYDAVQTEVNILLDGSLEAMGHGFAVLPLPRVDEYGDALYGPGNGDSTTVTPTWITVYETTVSAAGTNSWIDSIAFRNGSGVPVSNGADASSIVLIYHWDKSSADTVNTYSDYQVRGDFDFTSVNTATATLTGTYDATVIAKVVNGTTTEWYNFALTATATNLSYSRNADASWPDCPNTGTISVTADLVYRNSSGQNSTTSWTFDATFTDGDANVSVTFDGNSSSYSASYCN